MHYSFLIITVSKWPTSMESSSLKDQTPGSKAGGCVFEVNLGWTLSFIVQCGFIMGNPVFAWFQYLCCLINFLMKSSNVAWLFSCIVLNALQHWLHMTTDKNTEWFIIPNHYTCAAIYTKATPAKYSAKYSWPLPEVKSSGPMDASLSSWDGYFGFQSHLCCTWGFHADRPILLQENDEDRLRSLRPMLWGVIDSMWPQYFGSVEANVSLATLKPSYSTEVLRVRSKSTYSFAHHSDSI